jgi:hypothetical protein
VPISFTCAKARAHGGPSSVSSSQLKSSQVQSSELKSGDGPASIRRTRWRRLYSPRRRRWGWRGWAQRRRAPAVGASSRTLRHARDRSHGQLSAARQLHSGVQTSRIIGLEPGVHVMHVCMCACVHVLCMFVHVCTHVCACYVTWERVHEDEDLVGPAGVARDQGVNERWQGRRDP